MLTYDINMSVILCVQILSETLALYKSFTYLLTYLHWAMHVHIQMLLGCV